MKDSLLKSYLDNQIRNYSLIIGGASEVQSESNLNECSEQLKSCCEGCTYYYTDWKGSDGKWYSDSCCD